MFIIWLLSKINKEKENTSSSFHFHAFMTYYFCAWTGLYVSTAQLVPPFSSPEDGGRGE